ncbi:MAG: pyridoxal phosphate-dependent aminotransferase [Vulcanibacillus sp.]
MYLARRALEINPSPTLAINAKAKELIGKGIDIIGLGAGEPDFNTPENIIQAAYDSMKKGQTKYTAAAGVPELKQSVIDKFKRDNGLIYNQNQIIITNGAKHALYNFLQAVCNNGDEVIIPVPYWVSYPEMVKLAEGVPVYVEGKADNNYKITPEQLENAISKKTKVFIINSPNNPTGTIYTHNELLEIARVCEKHQILIVSDEIYEKLIYGNHAHFSIASVSEDAFERTTVINGVSKPYSMTGWRIGYAAGNAKIIKTMADISSHSTSNPVSFAQYGAIEAMNGPQDELIRMKNEFENRRNFVLEQIKDIGGFKPIIPSGAFYVFIDISDILRGKYSDADQWSEDLLEKAKVAVVPGSGFGSPNFIRLSYATSLEQLDEGIKRIKEFIRTN